MSGPIPQPYGSIEWLASGEHGNASEHSIARMIMQPDTASAGHAHPNCEESAYIIRGEVEETIGGVVHHLRAGDLAVAPRAVAHHFRNTGASEAEILLVFSSPTRLYEPRG